MKLPGERDRALSRTLAGDIEAIALGYGIKHASERSAL